jgi:hypothetical protein
MAIETNKTTTETSSMAPPFTLPRISSVGVNETADMPHRV